MTSSARSRLAFVLAWVALLPVARAEPVTTTVEFADSTIPGWSAAEAEASILRLEPRLAAGFLSRTGVYLFVADGEDAWARDVAPGLAEALEQGPDAVAAFAAGLPSSVQHAGPDLAGGALRVTLPGAGEGFFALHLPLLLAPGKPDARLLGTDPPNRGRFLSGVALDGEELDGVSLSSWPKALIEGGLPPVEVRPKQAPGALTILNGRGATGEGAGELSEELSRWSQAARLPLSALRAFPDDRTDLLAQLRTARPSADDLDAEDGWYRGIADGPGALPSARRKVPHPSRSFAFASPLVVEQGGVRKGVVFGGVAFYTPLLLTPREAPLQVGVSPVELLEAVRSGAIPFLRDGDQLYFLRAHLDAWRAGTATPARGTVRGRREAAEWFAEQADALRSRKLSLAAERPLPLRFTGEGEAAPKGRAHEDDLREWMRRLDPGVRVQGPAPTLALDATLPGAAFSAMMRATSKAVVASPAAIPAPGVPALSVREVYLLSPSCRPGEQVQAVLEFTLAGPAEGELATLALSWGIDVGGKALVRFAAEIERGAGQHEVVLEAGCPSTEGRSTLQIVASWAARSLEGKGSVEVVSRRASSGAD